MTLRWKQNEVDAMFRGRSGEVAKDLERRARAVERAASSGAPRATGALAGSFSTEWAPEGRSARFSVFSTSDHFWPAESGRGEVTPTTKKVLVWSGGGGDVFAKSAGPVAGRHFFARSVDAATR